MKDDYIRIRMRTEDKEAIKARAEQLNMSISEYIMRLVIKDIGK